MSESSEYAQVNAAMWYGMGSSYEQVVWYQVLLVAFEMFLLCAGISQTRHYLQLFGRKDNRYFVIAIGMSVPVITALAAANIALTYNFVFYGRDDLPSFHRFDQFFSVLAGLVGCVVISVALSYCSWKAWKLSGRNKWLVVPLVLSNIVNPVFFFPIAIVGLNYPWGSQVTINDLDDIGAYHHKIGMVLLAWVFSSTPCELFVCLCMMALLLAKRSTAFDRGKTLVNKLILFLMVSMLPPTIVVLVITAWSAEAAEGKSRDGRRLVMDQIAVFLYWNCLLYSLLSRDSIRQLLDNQQVTVSDTSRGEAGLTIGDLRTTGSTYAPGRGTVSAAYSAFRAERDRLVSQETAAERSRVETKEDEGEVEHDEGKAQIEETVAGQLPFVEYSSVPSVGYRPKFTNRDVSYDADSSLDRD